MLSVLISGKLPEFDCFMRIPYSVCQLSASICFVFQDGGTALMAASKSDHTGAVQLVHSSGEPKDWVRHNMN